MFISYSKISDLAKIIWAKFSVPQVLGVALLGSCTAKMDNLLDTENII